MSSFTQSEQAYQEIRRRLLILEVRPEDRIKEQEWADKLKLGRLAVREALSRLHGEGLVTRGAKGGFFAAKMTAVDIHDIHEVREIFEVAAIRLAQERMTPKQLQQLEDACDDFAYLVKRGYHVGACESDLRFHHLLVECSGNSKLVRAYDLSHIPLFHVRVGHSREYLNDYAYTEREHREIVAALKEKDFEKAIERLRAHFDRGESAVLSQSDGT
ncbi:MAG: GntR family transcriptional regulator [Chloroflexota bacterium]|nr:MAG: GntR family transcriptional regulator [Chloroflexota bacterium]